MKPLHWNLAIGLFFLVFAGISLFLWIPNDIDSGVLHQVRRRIKVGDAMFPVMVMWAMFLVSACLVLFASIQLLGQGPLEKVTGALHKENGTYLARLLGIGIFCFVLMVGAGTWLVGLLNALGWGVGTYRQLLDTVPYKYIGFLLGGFFLVFSLISLIEGHPTKKALCIALAAVLALIATYDLPFENLLLPPNGDH